MSKVLTIAGANLRRFLRERSNLFFVFVFPLGLVLLLGLLFGGNDLPRLGVVAGNGSLSEELVTLLEARPGIETVRVSDPQALRERLARGELVAGLVVPTAYDRSLAQGRTVRLELLVPADGTGAPLRLPVSSAAGEQAELIRAAHVVAERSDLPFDEALAAVRARVDDAPQLRVRTERTGSSALEERAGTFALAAPSQLVLFMFLTGLTASAALIQSRRLGVSRRMLSTPTPSSVIVAGEALGRLAVTLFQGVYILLGTLVLFRVDWGDPLAALALLAAFAAVAAGGGMLVGALFENDQQASGVAVVLGLGLAALGGAMVPLELFGPTMRALAHLTPHAWAIDGYAVLVRRGGALADVLPHLAVLAAFAVALLSLASWRLRAVLTRT